MEESVWLYFGVIAIFVTIAILVSVFIAYDKDSTAQQFSDSLKALSVQVETVCKSPQDTQLPALVVLPAKSVLYAAQDRLCITLDDAIQCEPSACPLQPGTLVNLTDVTLFKSHQYTCTVLHDDKLVINCQG